MHRPSSRSLIVCSALLSKSLSSPCDRSFIHCSGFGGGPAGDPGACAPKYSIICAVIMTGEPRRVSNRGLADAA